MHHTNIPTKAARASFVTNSETPARDVDSRTGFDPVNCAETKNDIHAPQKKNDRGLFMVVRLVVYCARR